MGSPNVEAVSYHVGTIERARERFYRTARLCVNILDVENLNVLADQMGLCVGYETGSYIVRDCIREELDLERKTQDRRKGIGLVKPREA
jgi:hypothetical protein